VPNIQITQPFNEPFFEGSVALPSYFSPSVVGIAGVPYLMDTEGGGYRRQAFDVVQQRNTSDNRDILLLPQEIWRQQVQSWHQGAGQANQDRDDSLPYRFENSFGIDPWTRYEISLLPGTERFSGLSASGQTFLTTYDEYLAVVNDESVYWYGSLSASATPVSSTTVSVGNTVVDVADLAPEVTVLLSDGYIYTMSGPSASPVQYYNVALTGANMIAWEKDYLLCGHANVLKWVKPGNQIATVYTHPEPTFRWLDAAEGDSCVYLVGGVAGRSEIHRVNIKPDGTGLNPAIVAATLPDGERAYSIKSYLGFVLIGTSKGVRVAQRNNDAGDLTLGPVIPTAEPVYCFEGQDRFVWYGNSSIDGTYGSAGGGASSIPNGPVCGLGRLDLSVTTLNQLTPAYANDLVALDASGEIVRAVVTFQDKRVFSVDDVGVYFESNELMEQGWLTLGVVSYSVEDLKTGLYEQVKWRPDCAGTLGVDAAYDSPGFVRLVNLSVNNTVRSGHVSLSGNQFSRLNTRFLLGRCPLNTAKGPTITRWEVRAIPVKGQASRWTLPILNYEETEIDGVKYTRDPKMVVDALIGLVESSRLFILQEAGRSYQVHAKDFVWQPEKLTANGQGWQGTFTLVVEEVQ